MARKKAVARITGFIFILAVFALVQAPMFALPHPAPQGEATPSQSRPSSFMGTVQSINGTEFTARQASGAVLQIDVGKDARVLRIEPGEKSLKSAVAFPLSSLAVGDRVLARGALSSDGKKMQATLVVAIRKSDILAKQAQEREEWKQHGVDGLVKSVDLATGTVVLRRIGRPPLLIETSPKTVLRRYAPGSVQFDQAKPAPLSSIKPGDELRARGALLEDSGGEKFAAAEIVSGTFRNIAGPVVSVDPSASTLVVEDIAGKHPVTVKVTSSTQMKKLSPPVADRIAEDLRKAGGKSKKKEPRHQPGFDPHQVLAEAPAVPLSSFTKGEDVMLVATEAGENAPVTAITLIGGVKPMLDASASGSQAMLSSAWNLGGSPEAGAGGNSSEGQQQ